MIMKRTISVIESIIQRKASLSQRHFHSISPPPLHSIPPPSSEITLLYQRRIYSPFTTHSRKIPISDHNNFKQQSISQKLSFDPIASNPPRSPSGQRLWKLLGLGSMIPLISGIYLYLDKVESNNVMKYVGEFKQEEVLPKVVEMMPLETNVYEMSHYSFYLGLFLAFTYFKKQPAHFGPSLSFFFILFSFLGLLFSNISSNLANYSALNAKAAFFYQISGTWSNHEGSILLWCLILSFYGFLFCLPRSPR